MTRRQQSKAIENEKKKKKQFMIWMKKEKASNAILTPYA